MLVQIVREEKADIAAADAVAGTDRADNRTERRTSVHRKKSLRAAGSPSRSRSRSRRATITDQGQTGPLTSVEQLSHLAPPDPGLAEATRIAPERQASALAVPENETPTLGIAVQKADMSRPASPPETLIPATDTLSTRPTRGGIAYPFRLKVEGGDRDVNASTVTLQSMGGMEGEDAEKSGNADLEKEAENLTEKAGEGEKGLIGDEVAERPYPERFVTADTGELAGVGEKEKVEKSGKEQVEDARPGVERFETAMEHPK